LTIAHLDRRAAIGEVTTAITHELNQPLEAILHNAEAAEMLLDSGRLSEGELREILADIRRIDARAGSIVQRMRGLLRKKEFETQPIDLNELTRDTVAFVMPVAGSKGVRLGLELAGDLEPIAGDRIHLQQVLLNILLNGIEATSEMPREGRHLDVTTLRCNGRIEVAVRDRGHGIPADPIAQIFEPFFTTKGEGMGIGLSIARTIVEAHGGRIAARNNPDGGATVWFTLPSSGRPA
jgi:two-component system sensor kinase FixL